VEGVANLFCATIHPLAAAASMPVMSVTRTNRFMVLSFEKVRKYPTATLHVSSQSLAT
jgi:hypothetical protein